MRSFNTAGPVNQIDHYLIAPLSRIDQDEVLGLVRDKKYFVLHAPRQTGKTSALLALAEVLNGRGYRCVYVTVETARTARDDVQRAMRTVLAALASQARATLNDGFLDRRSGSLVGEACGRTARHAPARFGWSPSTNRRWRQPCSLSYGACFENRTLRVGSARGPRDAERHLGYGDLGLPAESSALDAELLHCTTSAWSSMVEPQGGASIASRRRGRHCALHVWGDEENRASAFLSARRYCGRRVAQPAARWRRSCVSRIAVDDEDVIGRR